ncbi:helix-turn-helix domain-containing protein [Algoriphagus sanaruensis]|uniref:HTH araC/xylS-type domain-containing protein n=1 Tax=Algoriphagus sanaruensis TaxID=1727163 RepID=A0A142EKF7_9BACT|nr:AraC family transcriptional regulator [Algoriphagus sanaruensis]AMQ55612.1 hypothetical protein AO498_04290 [Algoriphagus sanaruensis]
MFKVLFLILFILFLLIAVLVVSNGDKKDFPIRFFSYSLLSISIFLVSQIVLFDFGYIQDSPFFLRAISPIMFLTAPLFYLGVLQLTNSHFSFQKKYWLHSLPFFLAVLDSLPVYVLPLEEKRKIAELMLSERLGWMFHADGFLPIIWVDAVRYGLMVIYYFLAWRLIFVNDVFTKKVLKIEAINFWLKPTLLFFAGFHLASISQYSVYLTYYFSGVYLSPVTTFNFIVLFLTLFSFILYFFNGVSIKIQPKNTSSFLNPNREQNEVKKDKVLPEAQKKPQKPSIEKILQNQIFFLNPNLRIADLEDELGMNPKQLSDEIFKEFGKSTKEFINSLRIEFSKSKIEEGYLDDFTIDALAEISGFNSRITFYRAFKKETSMTPSEYWDLVRSN